MLVEDRIARWCLVAAIVLTLGYAFAFTLGLEGLAAKLSWPHALTVMLPKLGIAAGAMALGLALVLARGADGQLPVFGMMLSAALGLALYSWALVLGLVGGQMAEASDFMGMALGNTLLLLFVGAATWRLRGPILAP